MSGLLVVQVVLATLEPQLAMQSLYGAVAKAAPQAEEPEVSSSRPPVNPEQPRRDRGIHITFETEDLDTSVPEVQELYNLRPR